MRSGRSGGLRMPCTVLRARTTARWRFARPTRATGATHDLGVRLPASTGQGAGLAARWDTRHGYALLLAHPSNGGTGGTALQAWLVSFPAPSSTLGASQ